MDVVVVQSRAHVSGEQMGNIDFAIRLFCDEILRPGMLVGQRWTLNVLTTWSRISLSVGVPTLIRQSIAYAMESAFSRHAISSSARAVMGGTFGALPVALTIAGGIRDEVNHTATRATRTGRVLGGIGSLIALAGAQATGTLARGASTLISAQLYCVLRDIVEMYVRQSDNNNGLSLPAVGVSAAAYGVNQLAGGMLSGAVASPAGASAASIGTFQWRNELIRSAINSVGEMIDDMTLRATQHTIEQRSIPRGLRTGLEVGLDFNRATAADFSSRATSRMPGRLMLFSTVIMGSYALDSLLPQNGELSKNWIDFLSNLFVAAILAAGYSLFVCHLMQQRPPASSIEDGRRSPSTSTSEGDA